MKTILLGSKWTGLNPSLLASIFPVDEKGLQTDGPTVVSPPLESTLELTANWQSAFEQSGLDARLPLLTQTLQSGIGAAAFDALGKATGPDTTVGKLLEMAAGVIKEGAGRSGMTKLNSTQIFCGAAPVKLPITLKFRAFSDPASEVQEPIDQLARWTLARQLARDGTVVSAVKNFTDGQGLLKSLLPSVAPQMVGLRFGGYLFSPLVIESMAFKLTEPRASSGELLQGNVQLMLASLTALDAEDWNRSRRGLPSQLWNN
ncbi:hypothetical protein CLD22_02890 [Rubrivivax gelatinosus]|nr:hypothetical protein [Rubrivivax gelatinosus]